MPDRHSRRLAWASDADGWWVDGIPLSRVAYTVAEISGMGPPSLRGSNVATAQEPGKRHRAKIHDSRTITLALWLIPAADESIEDAMRDLWRIVGKHASTLTLTRRMTVDGRVEDVEAEAELLDRAEASPRKPGNHADIAVDFHLPDPYWYLPSRTKTVDVGGATHRIWNPGTVERHFDPTVTLNGPLTDPTLTNNSLDGGMTVTYTGTIASGSTITLDSREMTAEDDAGNSVASSVTKSGTWWMEIAAERNEFTLTASSGDGTADVKWRPALL